MIFKLRKFQLFKNFEDILISYLPFSLYSRKNWINSVKNQRTGFHCKRWEELLIVIFIQIFFLLNFAPFLTKLPSFAAHGSMSTNTGPDCASCGCEGGTSLPFPLWSRMFQMFLRLSRAGTTSFHSHPLYFSSDWYFDPFFKICVSHRLSPGVPQLPSPADPQGASAHPVAPNCLLQGPDLLSFAPRWAQRRICCATAFSLVRMVDGSGNAARRGLNAGSVGWSSTLDWGSSSPMVHLFTSIA